MANPAAKEKAAIQRLIDAINWAETYYPLPRCVHGKAIQDHAGDLLEPTCGCKLSAVQEGDHPITRSPDVPIHPEANG